MLNNGNGTLPAFLSSEWAWVNQEMRKGVWPLLVPGNNQAGWGFNHDYDVPDYTNDQGQVFYKVMPPDQANQLSDDSIRANSFFRDFDNGDLYGANGSAVAQDWHLRAQVLAEGIPALSRAMGRNQLDLFTDRNVDMMTQKNNGAWPQERLSDRDKGNRWLHSDIKDIAYPFLYPVFDDLVQRGGL